MLKPFLLAMSRWDTPFEEFQLSVSIGLVPYTLNDSGNLDEVLKNADNALYRAESKWEKYVSNFLTIVKIAVLVIEGDPYKAITGMKAEWCFACRAGT